MNTTYAKCRHLTPQAKILAEEVADSEQAVKFVAVLPEDHRTIMFSAHGLLTKDKSRNRYCFHPGFERVEPFHFEGQDVWLVVVKEGSKTDYIIYTEVGSLWD